MKLESLDDVVSSERSDADVDSDLAEVIIGLSDVSGTGDSGIDISLNSLRDGI